MGAGAGTGLSAKCEEVGGADLIIVYNSGRFRMAGLPSSAGSMPYGDANQIVVDLAAEILPRVRSVPVIAGVAAGDPFRMMHVFVRQLEELGFAGVQNFPTVGIHEGAYREHLESAGMGFDREVELIALAHERDLLTTPYAFTPDEAISMAEAGADVIVAHVGRTVSGMVGASTSIGLESAVERIQEITDAARSVSPEVIVLCHGGPLATVDEVQFVLDRTRGVDGFYGASSMERIPAERAITENMREFKALRLGA
jgi:predicted TIM-barrel enzyme